MRAGVVHRGAKTLQNVCGKGALHSEELLSGSGPGHEGLLGIWADQVLVIYQKHRMSGLLRAPAFSDNTAHL